MPSDKEQGHLRDILSNINLAEQFIGKVGEDEFGADKLRLYAVTRCLEIISEASRRLDPELKLRHPEVNWRAVAAAGNIYRHEYEGVLSHEIFKTVKLALPMLRTAVSRELST